MAYSDPVTLSLPNWLSISRSTFLLYCKSSPKKLCYPSFSSVDAPVCYNSRVEEHGVGRGESVRIACEVIANPADDMRFVWRFNNTSSNEELPLKQNSNGTRSFAEFEPKSEFDYGTLSCWARNSVGETKEPCIFKIYPAGQCPTINFLAFLDYTKFNLDLHQPMYSYNAYTNLPNYRQTGSSS